MLERGHGRVLNVSSGSSQASSPGLALYSVSKLAMERWNEYMDLELAGRGVSFNTSCGCDPVVATTEGWHHVRDTQGEDVATGGEGLPADLLTPQDAAGAVVWLATRANGLVGPHGRLRRPADPRRHDPRDRNAEGRFAGRASEDPHGPARPLG